MLSQTTLVPLAQSLDALSGMIEKAETYCLQRKIAPETLLYARLYPDMYHFTRQVQTTCDFAQKIAARLSARDPETLAFDENSFAGLKALVARATASVRATDAATVDAMVDKDVTFQITDRPVTMTGVSYAARFGMPNFYFHASMAYAILRENGLDLGKVDFIGRIKG